MKSLTKPELMSLLAVAKTYSAVDYLMLLVTVNHGLRVSETLALTRMNLAGNRLTVHRLKGSRKTSQVMFNDEGSALSALATGNSGFLFLPEYENRDSARTIFWRKMQKYGIEAGIPAEKLHPHALKHTCGRLSYEGGMGPAEIQNWMGHVDGKNSMVYMQATDEQAAAAFAAAMGK